MRILDRIDSIDDLKLLPLEELPALAEEIRGDILNAVASNGGHLGSSLGAVELAIALHYVFESPKDKIVWDVGHQAYAHKILTNRKEQMSRLRRIDGISGFPKRTESEHDIFGTGHASTSISAALGIQRAMHMKGAKGKAVAVIGDGGLTGGLAYEALNHAGSCEDDLVVILNDNAMSISPSVGAVSYWLSRKLTGRTSTQFRNQVKSLLGAIPDFGTGLVELIKRALVSSKALLTPGILFEGLGFRYIGPIDGHRVEELIATMNKVRSMGGPVLVHVITIKGKGYLPALKSPERLHGTGPFEKKTGKPLTVKDKKKRPFTRIFRDSLIKLAHEDPRIVAITAAMPSGTGLDAFARQFPERFYDVGIAEGHAVCFAAGLATQGMRPVIAIYSTFLQRAYDQIVHDVCLQNLPVTFALDRAGLVGEDGPTHHGVFDLAYLRAIPNMMIMAPKDGDELQHMLFTAINHHGPAAVRFPRGAGVQSNLSPKPRLLPLGSAELCLDAGECPDVLFITIGDAYAETSKAAQLLASQGLRISLINARFVKPLDRNMIAARAADAGAVVTVEEGVVQGGFGSAVLETLAGHDLLNRRVLQLGVPDTFIRHGTRQQLLSEIGLDSEGIARSTAQALSRPASIMRLVQAPKV